MQQNNLERIDCFVSSIYTVKKPEFLDAVRESALKALAAEKPDINEIYPVRMSGDISQDPSIQGFCEYVAITALQILSDQGYNVEGKAAFFTEMWCQEHHKFSQMDQHVHHSGVQIAGFYFLDTPENGSVATFHDPRAGKVQLGITEKNLGEITPASNSFHFGPEPGQLLLTNAWLPHSFTKNANNSPSRFVHFNIALTENTHAQTCQVEVI